jgi:hypothetical protein
VYVVKESVGTYDIVVDRKNGADGLVTIAYKTTDINAIAGKDYLSKTQDPVSLCDSKMFIFFIFLNFNSRNWSVGVQARRDDKINSNHNIRW